MSTPESEPAAPSRPFGVKIIDLVIRLHSTSVREHRERAPALAVVIGLYNDLLAGRDWLAAAPFDSLIMVIGIDTWTPKRPWLGRLSRKRRELEFFLELDYGVIRNWTTDDWIAGLVPLVKESIDLVTKRYRLPSDALDSAYRAAIERGAARPDSPPR